MLCQRYHTTQAAAGTPQPHHLMLMTPVLLRHMLPEWPLLQSVEYLLGLTCPRFLAHIYASLIVTNVATAWAPTTIMSTAHAAFSVCAGKQSGV